MNKTHQRNMEQCERELQNYWSHVKFPRDFVTIHIKEKTGHYVKAPAETVSAIKLPPVLRAGASHTTHTRFIDIGTGNIRHIPNKWIDRIIDLDGKDISPAGARTSWKIKDYDIVFDPALSKWSCTCKGFQFRKKCKHIQECKNEVPSV